MLIKYKWTASITLNELPNEASITVLPWQTIDVTDDRAQSLKDIYWNSEWEDLDNVSAYDIILTKTITLTTTQVKALNTTPQQLVVAPWAGKAIMVEKAIFTLDYNSATYATNVDLYVTYDITTAWDWGWANTLVAKSAILEATADNINYVPAQAIAEYSTVINKGITAIVTVWNPATWNSPVKITVFYRIVNL